MPDALRSIDDLERDRQEFLSAGDRRAAAICDREIGIALAEAGELEPALVRIGAARTALESGSKPGDIAICDHCFGIVLARLGREHEALQRLESARSAYASLHRYLAVADCEEHIGYALLALAPPRAGASHPRPPRRGGLPPQPRAHAARRSRPHRSRRGLRGRPQCRERAMPSPPAGSRPA